MSNHPTKYTKGSDLPQPMQEQALRRYVYRYTGEHTPKWAKTLRDDGTIYPLQFVNDAEWLANSWFAMTKDDEFDERQKYCVTNPTWPNNPELRKMPPACVRDIEDLRYK